MSKDRRRANGEGTTYQRSDGRWVAAWTETDATGTTKRRSKYAATEREAKAALKAALRRVEDGLPGVDATTPLTVYAERWASTTLAAADVKESTRDLYRSALRLWVLPLLGRMPLSRLRASDVEGLVVRLELEGKGPAARRTAYTVLRRVLDAAVRDELLARNPAASVPRPRVDSAAGASRFLDREQVGALLAASRGGRLEPLVVLLAYTGLRIGEALALRWEDVDLDGGQVRVTGTLGWVDGAATRTAPKSARSRRAVALPTPAMTALRSWRSRQAAERLAATWWAEGGWVFTTPVGTVLDHSNAMKAYKRLAATAGVPGATFHGLRHAAASVLLREGVPMRVVAEVLGHSSTRLTADVYSHVTAELTDRAAAALERGYA